MSNEEPHVCFDRGDWPAGLTTEVANRATGETKGSDDRMAVITSALWSPGQTISATFVDHGAWGTDAAKRSQVEDRIKSIAQEWMQYANLKIVFTEQKDAAVRISFK